MDPMLSSAPTMISETWGNPLSEVSENPLSSNDPFNVDLESGPKIKFLPTKHIQRIRKSIFENLLSKMMPNFWRLAWKSNKYFFF